MLRINNICSLPFFVFAATNGVAMESSFSRDGYDKRIFLLTE